MLQVTAAAETQHKWHWLKLKLLKIQPCLLNYDIVSNMHTGYYSNYDNILFSMLRLI